MRERKNKKPFRSSVIAVLSIACLALTGWLSFVIYQDREHDLAHLELVRGIDSSIIHTHRLALKTAEGAASAASDLQAHKATIDGLLERLAQGRPGAVPPVHSSAQSTLQQAQSTWRKISERFAVVLNARSELKQRRDLILEVEAMLPALESTAEQISVNLVKQSASGPQIYYATKQLQTLKELSQLILRFGDNDEDHGALSEVITESVSRYGQTLSAFMNGGKNNNDIRVNHAATRALLAQNMQSHTELKNAIASLVSSAEVYERVDSAVGGLPALTEELTSQLSALRNKIDSAVAARQINPQQALLSGGAGLFLFILFVIFVIGANKERAKEAVSRRATMATVHKQNQAEMAQLIQEIKPLTQGDLTTRAGVEHNSTGPIARVFNNAVEQMEKLLASLQETSSAISTAAEQSTRTSANLKGVKARSEDVLDNTSQLARRMSQSIEVIGRHAEDTTRSSDASARAVEVGRQSIDKTHHAVGIAQKSIRVSSDMVKKLGEDIQQIRSIVLTIREITNHLQALSYNTQLIADRSHEAEKDAISATADKMESLAGTVNRSLEDIEQIVTSISSRAADTQSHIEQSRADFNELVKTSTVTLESFSRIEMATKEAHEYVREITTETQALSNTSQRFIENIFSIEQLSQEQSAATEETTQAVSKLNYLAVDLQKLSREFITNSGRGHAGV